MLDWIRERTQGWFAKVILILIIVPFALFGINSYFSHRSSDDTVALVNGDKITRTEFESAIKEQRSVLAASMGANFDPHLFDDPKIRMSILEGLIKQRLLLEAAKASGLNVSDRQLQGFIASIPAFQDNNQFSVKLYQQKLAEQGMTVTVFEQRARQDILIDEMRTPFSGSAFVPSSVAETFLGAMAQQREISQFAVTADAFLAQANVTPQQIKAYYDSHQADYTVPVQARFQYAVLSLSDMAKRIVIDPAAIKQDYEQNLAKYAAPEQREARHILVAVPAGASAQQRSAAQARAERLYRQVSADPASFAAVAKQYSDDHGSAAQGGDLGWFLRDLMVKPFADAVFGMKPNQIAGPVATDYGYHIIQLTGIKPAHTRSYDEVADDITLDMQKQQAIKRFADAAERFSDQVFEQPQTLTPIAQALKISLQTSPWISRTGEGATVPLNSPKMLQALFSAEVLKNKHNSEAVEVAPNTLVSARLIDYKPAFVQPMATVSAAIAQQLKLQQARDLAQKQGAALLAELRAGKEPATIHWSAFQWVSRDHAQNMAPALVSGVFSADEKKLPGYVGAVDASGNYQLVRVTRVLPGPKADPLKLRAAQIQLANAEAEQAFGDYIVGLEHKAKITIKDIPFAKVGE